MAGRQGLDSRQPLDVKGFAEDTPDFSYGVGARLGLLRESFTMPGISVSLMYHRLGTVSYGDVCDQPLLGGIVQERNGYTVAAGPCVNGEGDPGGCGHDCAPVA